MKAQLFVLSAAGLLLAGAPFSSATAASAGVQRFLAAANADAGERLKDRGVVLGDKTVVVRARVGIGRLNGGRVVGASGSAELDDQIAAALRNVPTEKAPPELVGREITLTLGQPGQDASIASR